MSDPNTKTSSVKTLQECLKAITLEMSRAVEIIRSAGKIVQKDGDPVPTPAPAPPDATGWACPKILQTYPITKTGQAALRRLRAHEKRMVKLSMMGIERPF